MPLILGHFFPPAGIALQTPKKAPKSPKKPPKMPIF